MAVLKALATDPSLAERYHDHSLADESILDYSSEKKTREAIVKSEFHLLRDDPSADSGDYLRNYAICLLNRQVDIYDDAILILDGGRLSSACIVCRGMIETYAIAKIIREKIFKILSEKDGAESLHECDKALLNFIKC